MAIVRSHGKSDFKFLCQEALKLLIFFLNFNEHLLTNKNPIQCILFLYRVKGKYEVTKVDTITENLPYVSIQLKGKDSLSAMYALKKSALEIKHLGANLIKIGLETRKVL